MTMICVLSPAKAMDLSGPPNEGVLSRPKVKDHEELLKGVLRLTKADLKGLMDISDAIAQQEFARYQSWGKLARKAACLAMDGPAYRGFEGGSLSPKMRLEAQRRVRILSGLYGVLKPFDAIKPYRLEMGSKVKTQRGSNLYDFWREAITRELRSEGASVVVNAASQEYWKAVKEAQLGVPVVTVDFPGPSVFAKRARGLICRYVVDNKCQKPDDLRRFVGRPGDRYQLDAARSNAKKLVFRRLPDCGAEKPSAGLKVAPAAKGKAAAKAKAKAAAKRPAASTGGAGGKRARVA